jgi:hypothetical protein
MDKSPLLHEIKFAFSDFVKLLKRHKGKVLLAMLAGAIAVSLLAVTRPVVFLVHGSFRDKAKTQAAIRSALSDFLSSTSSSYDSEAISTMKSQYLISEVIRKLDSQGSIAKVESSYPRLEYEMNNAYDNILAEWAYWWNYKVPILKELNPPLRLKNIRYDGETIDYYLLTFLDERTFQIQNGKGEDVGKGALDVPVELSSAVFTVFQSSEVQPKPQEKFGVLLFPLPDLAALYAAHLVIDIDKDDKTLLKLRYKHRDRHFAREFLNSLMEAYQNRLVNEHELTSNIQVDYLERRQREVGSALEKIMQDYVQKVSDDMSQSGFTSLQREMDFLAANLANNQGKLAEIALETKRLRNIDADACVHYDTYTSRGDPAIINHLLAEIRSHKQQADTLELALQKSLHSSPEDLRQHLDENLRSIAKTHACSLEANELIQLLEGNRKSAPTLKILDTPDYPVATWYAAYLAKEQALHNASDLEKMPLQKEWEQFRDQFRHYLGVFQRIMQIQEAAYHQRMRIKQDTSEEYAGISLDTCRNLYLNYVKELNELQAHEKQYTFVVDQLKAPDFEISSLSALLHDPISHERVAKATQLAITLKDESNRTQRERERLQEELDLQKTFLTSHIEQMAELAKLKQELLQEKISSLQAATLDLIHQHTSLLKNHLSDYINSRISNLEQEKKLLEDHQAALHTRMSEITSKWASEQFMNHNLTMHQKFLENLASMVESKNITKNLEMIQSAPLDRAHAPLNPKVPHLLFYSIFGAILGFLGYSSFLFARTMIRGVPASLENLRLANFHVSGAITPFHGDEKTATPPLLDSDLDTLRRLVAHYEQDLPTHREALKLLIVNGKGPDFSNTLALLLSKKGQSVLKLQLGFKRASDERAPGLLQYLEGKAEWPHVEHLEGFDLISAGGTSRYSEELLRSPRFVELLGRLKTSYDWILGVAPVVVAHAEAENLAKLFDGTVIVVSDEPLQDLLAFSETLDEARKDALTFVLA